MESIDETDNLFTIPENSCDMESTDDETDQEEQFYSLESESERPFIINNAGNNEQPDMETNSVQEVREPKKSVTFETIPIRTNDKPVEENKPVTKRKRSSIKKPQPANKSYLQYAMNKAAR